jgi:1-deoxy-D-xylulose-5-phosphate reductoisomerase
VVHPQSLVHALVTFVDGASLGQFAPADMKLPIRRALAHPETWGPPFDPPLEVHRCGPLTFEPVDNETFPSITLARQALEAGGTAPAAYSAANEVAVAAFLKGRITLPRIWDLIAGVLERQSVVPADSLGAVEAAAGEARREAERLAGGAVG